MASIVTAEQRQSKDPIIQGWVKAKDAEEARNPPQVDPAYAASVQAFKDKNWVDAQGNYTGTANGKTESQNLASVIQQTGNTTTTKAIPYIKTDGTTDYHINDANGNSINNPSPIQQQQQQINTTKDDGMYHITDTGSVGNPAAPPKQDSSGINAQDYINQLNDLRKNATISALGKSKDAALSNLSSERSAIQPKYYDQRNQVAAGAQQQARNFAEYMAQRGGTNSGANAQATLASNSATQGNLGTLGRQEAADYSDIERRTTGINNAYESDVASATANAEADKMQALLQDYYTAQQRGDTLAQNQIQNAIAQSQLAMQQQGQQFDQSLSLTQQQQNEANTKFAQQMQIDGVAYQKARDAITDKNYQKEFENNIKQQGFENALKTALQAHQISNDNYQLAISQQNANTSANNSSNSANNANLNQLMDVWKATGKAPAGIPNVAAGTPYGGQTTPTPSGNFNLDDYKGYINQNLYKDVALDPNDPFKLTKQLDVPATERYILSQSITNDQKAQLYKLFGIPMK